MARKPVVPEPQVMRRFYILDDNVKGLSLGPYDIQNDNGGRHLLLTDAQAQYYVDQGAIGLEPKEGAEPAAQSKSRKRKAE